MSGQKNEKKVRFLPPIKRYVNAIEARLALPLRDKARVMSDISSTIEARHEAGESYEEIMKDMGAPDEVAAQFNEEMAPGARAKTPLRFVPLVLAAATCVPAVFQAISSIAVTQLLAANGTIGIIGGADGPTAVFVTSKLASPIEILFSVLTFSPAALAICLLGWYFLLAGKRRAACLCGILGFLFWGVSLFFAFLNPFFASVEQEAMRWRFLLAPSMWLSALLVWRSLRK